MVCKKGKERCKKKTRTEEWERIWKKQNEIKKMEAGKGKRGKERKNKRMKEGK